VNEVSDSGTHIITMADAGGSTFGQITGLTPASISYRNSQLGSVFLTTGTGSNTLNIFSTGSSLVSLEGHSGSTTVNVGNGTTQNIRNGVTITNPPSFTTVIVDDSADPGSRTTTVGTWSLFPAYGQITGLSSGGASIFFKYADTTSVTVKTGTGSNTVNVTDVVRPLTLYGNSNNTAVNVGNAHSMAGIQNTLTVHNLPSYTDLTLDDGADTAARTVTLTSTGVTGLSPGAIRFLYNDLKSLTILGGSGSNTYNVNSTPGNPVYTGTTLNTGGGVDTVNVRAAGTPLTVTTTTGSGGNNNDQVIIGTAGSLAGITAAVTVYNGPSRDYVTVDDHADGASHGAVVIGAGGITGLAPASAPLNFTAYSVSTLSVFGGGGDNTYTIAATPADTSMTLDTGGGVDTVNVRGTSSPLTVTTSGGSGGGGNDVVNVGLGSTQGIFGPVSVFNNPSYDHLNVDDSADAGNRTVTLAVSSITGLFPAVIVYGLYEVNTLSVSGGSGANAYTSAGSGALSTTLNTGTGVDRVNLQTVNTPLTVNSAAGSGADTIALGNAANDLAGIVSGVTVNAAATDALVLNDQGSAATRTYTVSPAAVTWTGGPTVSYTGLGSLTVNGGSGADVFDLAAGTSATAAVSVRGGGGTNGLLGSGAGNLWGITGADTGTLSGPAYATPVTFGGVGVLIAGSGGDTFWFADGATLSGIIAGGGSDTLDYSAYSTSVIVDLQTGFATGVGIGVSGIGTVYGGTGNGALGAYNLLIGSTAGGNTLVGGTGRRNLLVAGGLPSTLYGGDQEDLLIGGTTLYDTEAGLASWQAIAAYWAGADDYGTRVSNLTTGNGVPLLDATTVAGNGGGNTMIGNGELALIYTDGLDNFTLGPPYPPGFDPGSIVIPITP
jgi:hypothetical protein